MMSGLAILHTTRIIDLVREKEEKCTTELMQCMKSKLPISDFSMFGWQRGTRTSAHSNQGRWKESLSLTFKETTDTWCT